MNDLNKLTQKLKRVESKYKLETPSDLVNQYTEDKLYAKENPLLFGIPKIDEILDGDLRGKVIAILGLAGSKKSLIAAQCCNVNASVHQSRAVASNMEMDNTNFLGRLIDYALDPYSSMDSSIKESASKYHKRTLTRDNQTAQNEFLKEKLNKFYGDNLVVNGTCGMTIADYRLLLDACIEQYGSVDVLMVDGMSATGEDGSETERYSKVSMGLKSLAKEYKILITVICHLSKTAGGQAITEYTRDSRQWVRGSQKIIDDLDICICMSQIQDDATEDPRKDKGYIFMHDKRGTGAIVRVIYDFFALNLLMQESTDEPSMYDTEEKKSKY